VLSGNTVGINEACSGGTDSAMYHFEMPTTGSDNTLVFSAVATRQVAHAPGEEFVTRDSLINGSSGATAGITTQDKPALLNENIVINGTFGWETDWAVVAFEMHGDTVPPPPNSPPSAAFDYFCTKLDCDFTGQSVDSDGTVVAWSWTFGDGNGSSSQNPSHSYSADGTYTVSLTVTDDDGATNSTSQSVTVTAPPDTIAPSITAPANITVEATGVATPVNLGSPTVSDNVDPNPAVTNDAPAGFAVGITTVTWIATDASLNSATATQLVTVVNPASQPPGAPSNLTLSVQTSGKGKNRVRTAILDWSDNSDNEVNFVIEQSEQTGKGKKKSFGPFTIMATEPINAISYDLGTISGTFKYRVKATNDNGDSGYSNEVRK
jgi:PKD repeat protein